MDEKELLNIWKSYDQKLEEVLSLNKKTVYELTRKKLNSNFNSLRLPKQVSLLIGIPYTFILCFLTWVTFKADALIASLGFGCISLIMIGIIIGYVYHLFLIDSIKRSENIVKVQKRIAELKISNFHLTKLAIIQLPFWSVCWISIEGLKHSPVIYGGVNLIVFLGLSYLAFWLYQKLSTGNNKVSAFFLSGNEWKVMNKSSEILEQLKNYS